MKQRWYARTVNAVRPLNGKQPCHLWWVTGGYHLKWSHPQRDKWQMISLMCGIWKSWFILNSLIKYEVKFKLRVLCLCLCTCSSTISFFFFFFLDKIFFPQNCFCAFDKTQFAICMWVDSLSFLKGIFAGYQLLDYFLCLFIVSKTLTRLFYCVWLLLIPRSC